MGGGGCRAGPGVCLLSRRRNPGTDRVVQDGESWADNSLSGLEYLQRSEPDEYDAIIWRIRRPSPAVSWKAVGDGYSDYGRISAATGRATVLGWEGHQQQWRGEDQRNLLAGRRHDVATIYEDEDGAEVLRLLRLYDVRWLVVGRRERETYGGRSRATDGAMGRGRMAYAGIFSRDVIIYQVRSQ